MKKSSIYSIIALLALAVFWLMQAYQSPVPTQPTINTDTQQDGPAEQAVIERINTPEFGDLNNIKSRRLLRVLVSYSKTNFFFDGPEFKGFDYEIMREFEKYLNQNIKNEADKVVATFIVTPFADILTDLTEGRGDIAVANITITPERLRQVKFAKPYFTGVNEVIVQSNNAPLLNSIEDLAGQTVYLLSGSSFIPHIKNINKQFEQKQLAPINIKQADPKLSQEDIFELINAGIYPYTVADDFTAQTWQTVMPNLSIRENLKINSGGEIAWAVRKDSKELLASLNDFIGTIRKGSLLGNIFFNRYFENSKWIDNPTTADAMTRLDKHKPLFKRYADEYNFDWLSVVAMAYQESRIDQNKVSPKGAVGIMQIKPTTAASNEVGINDIYSSENNINAGVKYLAFLRDHYFASNEIAPKDKIDFTWAAYNAGPNRIKQLRKLAAETGYDPNIWFANVERIAAREIGRETVEYVANINKYYIAYKLAEANL